MRQHPMSSSFTPLGRAEAVLYSYLPNSAWSHEAARELVEYHMYVALELELFERASELSAALSLMGAIGPASLAKGRSS
ncbi:hypothetical protein [Microvirga terricola]|uniref:Uncharacterized protein n=1 Tax=Microvirga terricola TaxID=2719797 RepID=A0ABX0VCU2_9HYPH|nr:hypothetical protein [Microvirga terricola]NIX77261.1 hypothetical protein [Microvirga terricola]